jgi:anti-sigma factor RsiW
VSKLYTHEEALELLPWYVNGSLSEAEHADVERHVRTCLPCRVAMQEQHHLAALLKQQPTVPLSADGGFERLLAKIDGTQQPPRSRFFPRAPRLARLVTITTLAASMALAAWLVTLDRDSSREPTFVTATQPASDSVEIDIVFAAQVTEPDKQSLIREIGSVMTEPSDVGRYRVRLTDEDADRADEIVERLRGDARVRFAARAYSGGAAP